MQILRYKTSSIVLAVRELFTLNNGSYFCKGRLYTDATPETAEIVEVENFPEDFLPMKYVFNGEWSINSEIEAQGVAIEAAKVQLETNESAKKFLDENDYKCKKYRDQIDMIKFGVRESTDITEEEYKTLLIVCQEKRDLIA